MNRLETKSSSSSTNPCGTINLDSLVYELYGLTEEEIRIVEGKCV
jgi:hypothetical protein